MRQVKKMRRSSSDFYYTMMRKTRIGTHSVQREGMPMICGKGEDLERKDFSFRMATRADVPLILKFIRELAEYEKLLHEVVATEEILEEWIFNRRAAEVLFIQTRRDADLGEDSDGKRSCGADSGVFSTCSGELQPGGSSVCGGGDDMAEVGFALFFHNFSTFLGRSGLYLEDLYVSPSYRGRGLGKALLQKLAQIALERGCGRFEWWCLDWNRPSIEFYLSLGAEPMSDWTVYRMAGETLVALAGETAGKQ